MNNSRPKNLNLMTIHFPIPAIVSILHRLSGFVLFLLVPIVIGLFYFSLTRSGFETMHAWLKIPAIKVLLWLVLVPFLFHLVAGIRHLLMDIAIGVGLRSGRLSAILTFLITGLLIICAGIWLW